MRLHLPSGAIADLDVGRARAAARTAKGRGIARDVEVLSAARVLRAERDGIPLDLPSLTLCDLHLLRVALARRGAIDEPEIVIPCHNCEATLRIAPSMGVELGPFVDDELDDPELDAPFPFDRDQPIPAVRVGRTRARTIRLAKRTVGEARALWSRDPALPLAVVPSIITAMGIVALGEERRASVMSRALARASDDAWDEICAIWEEANGHARLFATARCDACGANNAVAAPAVRELGTTGGSFSARRRGAGAGTWDGDAFEQMVRRHADVAYRAMKLRNIDLVVDEGVPMVDDGGEPLLGCYTPPHVDPDLGIERPPEVRLFARSFRAELLEDPAFDLDGEVRETIEHELEHHLSFLAGDDPMDDEEREAIVLEQRRQVGRRESTRRGFRAIGADLVGFVRLGWPLLLIGALAAWLAHCAR